MSNSRLLEVCSTSEVSFVVSEFDDVFQNGIPLSSYELNRQRNNRINECNYRGIAVMFVQYTMRTNNKVK